MGFKYLILVCTSSTPQQTGICCKEKDSESLLTLFQAGITERKLEDVVVRASGCLHNCRMGASVKVFPGNLLYTKVTAGDVNEIIENHLIGEKPVERLLADRVNRFLGF